MAGSGYWAEHAAPPDFGPLAGVRVVYSGQALAGPFGAELMAEFGADVLWLENPEAPDLTRSGLGLTFQMERRNQRTLALNIPTPEGRKILLELLADADIFIESSKGGQFERWGLPDDVLWEANRRLVIVHTSGYGQDGEADYIGRAAFDPIAQAFGCYMQLNGPPELPLPAIPFPGDYLSGLFGAVAALSALHRAQATGEGDSIDVAMFEIMMRAGGTGPMAYLNHGIQPERKDTRGAHAAGCGLVRCGDARGVYVITRGTGVVKRMLEILEIPTPSELFPAGNTAVQLATPAGDLLDRTLNRFCEARSAQEVDELFNRAGIPCSMVYSYDLAEQNPHYQAREVFTEWEAPSGELLRGVNVVPKLKRRPGRIWRGSPKLGQDTVSTLRSVGYSDADIQRLCEANVVVKPED